MKCVLMVENCACAVCADAGELCWCKVCRWWRAVVVKRALMVENCQFLLKSVKF